MDIRPLYSLRLAAAGLELRLPDDQELLQLARTAEKGVHPPDEMPFRVPWTDPSPTFIEDFITHHQELRDSWSPDKWRLRLAVFVDGEPIGVQDIRADDFHDRRSVSSGSWLSLQMQGKGYGTIARAAILSLAFLGLDAAEARTEAMAYNRSSQRVTEKIGYQLIGENHPLVRGRPQKELQYKLSREAFLANLQAGRIPTVEIYGAEGCRKLTGAD